MKYLSQYYPNWSNVRIGKTPWTIGRIGCAITCISMISDYFGEFKTPDFIAKNAKFTPAGEIIWSSLASIFKTFKFVWREYSNDKNKILEALKNPNQACMIRVAGGSHWIVPIHDPQFSDDYVCADPLGGKIRLALGDYHDIDGVVLFSKI